MDVSLISKFLAIMYTNPTTPQMLSISLRDMPDLVSVASLRY